MVFYDCKFIKYRKFDIVILIALRNCCFFFHLVYSYILHHKNKNTFTSLETFVKKLKLEGKVLIWFTDGKNVSVRIGMIVSKLKDWYRRNQPADLSMLSVSWRKKSVKWDMELKVEQKWEVDARVNFPLINN